MFSIPLLFQFILSFETFVSLPTRFIFSIISYMDLQSQVLLYTISSNVSLLALRNESALNIVTARVVADGNVDSVARNRRTQAHSIERKQSSLQDCRPFGQIRWNVDVVSDVAVGV